MMRKFFIILALHILFVSTALGQITAVHGSVSDDMGELMGASVCEIDGSGRIIEATTTDMNGNFSMPVRNPKDRIRFSFVGCKSQTLRLSLIIAAPATSPDDSIPIVSILLSLPKCGSS